MVSVSENFKDLLNNYQVEMETPKSESEFASKIEEDYGEDLKNFVYDIVGEPDKYSVSIDVGSDKWLNAPVATIFNTDAGSDYMHGLFVGYSFHPKSGRLFVKIDQGIRGIGGHFDILYMRGEMLRHCLDEVPEEFKFEPNKCAAGNILGKFYQVDEINEESLEQDLKYLIETYEQLMPEYEKVSQLNIMDLSIKLREIYDQKWKIKYPKISTKS